MADDSLLSFVLDLDSSEFQEGAKSALESIQAIGDSGNLSGLIEGLGTAAEALGVAGLAVFAFKESLDLTTEGDQVKRIDEQFQILTTQAGISTTALKSGLENAAGGMVATTDLLQIANKAIVTMGSSASQLPEIMTLARQATTVFGGDVQTNFQNMVQAISTGNARLLKHMGIVVDTTAAYNKFADDNGIAANALSETAKQQALMNAVLDAGHQNFANVKVSVGDTIDALQAFKAAWNELKETISVIFSNTLGPMFASFFGMLKNSLHEAKNLLQSTFGSGAEKDTAGIEVLNQRISDTKKQLDDIQNHRGLSKVMSAGEAAQETALLTAQLKHYEEQLGKVTQKAQQNKAADDQATASKMANLQKVEQASNVDATQQKKNQEKFNSDMEKLQQQQSQDQIKNMQAVDKASQALNKAQLLNVQSLGQIETAIGQQQVLRQQANAEAIEKINQQFHQRELQRQQEIAKVKQANYLSDAQKAQELSAIKQKYAQDAANKDRLIDMQRKTYEQQEMQAVKQDEKTREQLLKNYQANSQNAFQGIARAAQHMAKQAQADLSNFGKQGQMVMNQFQSSATSAFEQIGKGIAANQSVASAAASAMKSAFLGMIGKVAEEYGTMLLLEGIYPPNPVALAAGAALLTLGGILSAEAGSGGSASGVSAGGGGATASASTSSAASTATTAADQASTLTQQQTVQRSVSVNISGNYLNTAATQRSLMEIMRNETDATGFQYNKIGT